MTIHETLTTICSIAVSSQPDENSHAAAFAYDSVVGHDLITLLQQESSDFAQRADTFAARNAAPVERNGLTARSWHEWVVERFAYAAELLKLHRRPVDRVLADNELQSAKELVETAEQSNDFQWHDDDVFPVQHGPTLAMRAVAVVTHFGTEFQKHVSALVDNAEFLVTALRMERERVEQRNQAEPEHGVTDDPAQLHVVQHELLAFIAKQGASGASVAAINHAVQKRDVHGNPERGYAGRTLRSHRAALHEQGLIAPRNKANTAWCITDKGLETLEAQGAGGM